LRLGSVTKDSNKDLRNTMAFNLEEGEDRGASMNESNLLDSINERNPLDSDYDRLGSMNDERE
jgi:hypothetical protein